MPGPEVKSPLPPSNEPGTEPPPGRPGVPTLGRGPEAPAETPPMLARAAAAPSPSGDPLPKSVLVLPSLGPPRKLDPNPGLEFPPKPLLEPVPGIPPSPV